MLVLSDNFKKKVIICDVGLRHFVLLLLLKVIFYRETDRSTGFGFVTMSTVEEAEKAVEMVNRYVSFFLRHFG